MMDERKMRNERMNEKWEVEMKLMISSTSKSKTPKIEANNVNL